MLVVVSDFHMTDSDAGAPVSDAELTKFVGEITALDPGAPMTLLLLGDILDLLRSNRWEQLWRQERCAAPWSALGERFGGFEKGHAEKRLLEIVAAIRSRYPNFSSALADLKANRRARIMYVIGNHDYMLQLSPRARAEVVSFLSLDHDPARIFPFEHRDEALGVYAEHGQRLDPINHHQYQSGRWALGDGIVLRVVNRFGTLACDELRLTDAQDLGRALHEIDNVEPHTDIPLYVAWLARTQLVGDHERDTLRHCWRETVEEFLALPQFREKRYGEMAKAIGWIRALYGIFDLDRLAGHLRQIPPSIGKSWAHRAHVRLTPAPIRIFGHTHEPGIWGLPPADGQPRYYVNTGTWRRVVTRMDVKDDLLGFAGHRVATYAVVRPGHPSATAELVSRWLIP